MTSGQFTPELTVVPPSSRLQEYIAPLIFLGMGLTQLPSTLWNILRTRPKDLFFYSRWADDYFGRVWVLFTEIERLEEKRRLTAGCQGIVIEVGPGFGPSIKHFDKEKVKHVYAVEPNLTLHEGLHKNITKFGWEGRCTIVSCGIEDDEGLRKAGVPLEGVDTVISIQVGISDGSQEARPSG